VLHTYANGGKHSEDHHALFSFAAFSSIDFFQHGLFHPVAFKSA
jgi:hypothetical protein